MKNLQNVILKILASTKFFWVAVGFLVFEGVWIALSSDYPMAFDEDFHLGIIKIYSEQWLPFLAGQPEGANSLGALATDPSYLFHYLMSFPYRLVALFTDSLPAQVIFLRLINVALIAAAVVVFRKVLLRAGTSPALVNVAALLFALVPSVALLAGQINYDNLLLLALAWVCWLVLRMTEDIQRREVNPKTFVLLAVALMLSSLIKYAFLPIALAVVIYVLFVVWRAFRGRWAELWSAIQKGYRAISPKLKVGLAALFLLSAGLFAQRYGMNMINYGHPVPGCGEVIGAEACMEYGPWGRNHRYAGSKPDWIDTNPVSYTWLWLQGMHYRMFFVIDGPPQHTNYPPAPLPSATAVVILIFGTLALVFYGWRALKGRPFLVFILLATIIYTGVLWAENYSQFTETGRPVAINGRYFIPLLLPMAAVFGRVLAEAFKPLGRGAKTWLAAAAILLFLQGGGVFSFILRSDEAWYWPNQAVISANETAQKILDPLIFEGPKTF